MFIIRDIEEQTKWHIDVSAQTKYKSFETIIYQDSALDQKLLIQKWKRLIINVFNQLDEQVWFAEIINFNV